LTFNLGVNACLLPDMDYNMDHCCPTAWRPLPIRPATTFQKTLFTDLCFAHFYLLSVVSKLTISAGLMPTEARGNYLPKPPYLRETKTYHSQPLESIRHDGNYFVPLSIRPIFIFLLQKLSNYLTTDGLKKISLLPEAPLICPEARGRPICHICHMVNPALLTIC